MEVAAFRKLIVLNDEYEVVGDWGPEAESLLKKFCTNTKLPTTGITMHFTKNCTFGTQKDRGQTTTHELLDLVDHCMGKEK